MSRCMQFTFGDEREVYLLDESALPVTEKESIYHNNPTTISMYFFSINTSKLTLFKTS